MDSCPPLRDNVTPTRRVIAPTPRRTRGCRSKVGTSPIPANQLWMGPVVRHTETMTESGDTRVAVYLDFDNIVISRYDQVNGRSSFQKDKAKGLAKNPERLARATVDVGAIIDFASSFGTLVLTRAYADWSAEVNTGYRAQLVGRAVDLVQLFPAAAYGKNGADIRLAVDAVEDMFRLPDLTHVVIVVSDSDYIPLAQRCKRLGRYVVGIGVAGSTSRALAAACDDFVSYDALPGVPVFEPAPHGRRRRRRTEAAHPPNQRGARGAATTGSAGHRHRTAHPRPEDRPGERRRRVAAQLVGQGPDEAHGPLLQRESPGVQVIQRLPAVLLGPGGARREFDDANGAVAHLAAELALRGHQRSQLHVGVVALETLQAPSVGEQHQVHAVGAG